MSATLSNIALEYSWDQPQAIGEISVLDIRTYLDASYYRNALDLGYKIEIQYRG